MSRGRKIGGGKKYEKGAYRSTGRGQHVSGGMTSVRHGGEVSLSITGFDAGRIPSDPSRVIGKQIRDALDPTKASSKAKVFSEMTDEEKAEMRRLYERGGRWKRLTANEAAQEWDALDRYVESADEREEQRQVRADHLQARADVKRLVGALQARMNDCCTSTDRCLWCARDLALCAEVDP